MERRKEQCFRGEGVSGSFIKVYPHAEPTATIITDIKCSKGGK